MGGARGPEELRSEALESLRETEVVRSVTRAASVASWNILQPVSLLELASCEILVSVVD